MSEMTHLGEKDPLNSKAHSKDGRYVSAARISLSFHINFRDIMMTSITLFDEAGNLHIMSLITDH